MGRFQPDPEWEKRLTVHANVKVRVSTGKGYHYVSIRAHGKGWPYEVTLHNHPDVDWDDEAAMKVLADQVETHYGNQKQYTGFICRCLDVAAMARGHWVRRVVKKKNKRTGQIEDRTVWSSAPHEFRMFDYVQSAARHAAKRGLTVNLQVTYQPEAIYRKRKKPREN